MVQPLRNAPPCPFQKVFPSQLVRNDEFYVWLAYNQAIDAWRQDEVPIGAIIELGGEVIASAHNQRDSTRDPTAHAEILALGQAAKAIGDWRLNEATLYVTKEPCPMCSGTTILYRIPRVIVGENRTYLGAEVWMRLHGIEIIVLDDPRCVDWMHRLQRERPDLWAEDIGD